MGLVRWAFLVIKFWVLQMSVALAARTEGELMLKPYRILMIDASAELRRVLRMAFELMAQGVRLLEAGTIAQARKLLAAEQPDLLLLDAELPDGSGCDFCREVRLYSDIPILMTSGLAEKVRMAEGYAAGCSDYLVKPYLLDTLLERVAALRGDAPHGSFGARGQPPKGMDG